MTDTRFYGDLASWWPLLSPPEEYAEEAAFAAAVIRRAARPVAEVLELGSGGGSNAAHLKASFAMTLTDIAPQMLAVSERVNPECEHVVGDMRTLRLGRRFDAVFVHDAIDYMTKVDDLRAAMETAYVHCRPGGAAVFVPDDTAETFVPATDCGGTDAADGRGARYLMWTWDPDPADTWTATEFGFLLRDADGVVRSLHETHRHGLFSLEQWLGLLAEVGFRPEPVAEVTSDDRPPRTFFLAHR